MNRRHFIIGSMGIAGAASAVAEEDNPLMQQQPFMNHGKNVSVAPFGERISSAISYYNRVSPYIANAGLLHPGGLAEAKAHNFKLIVDLRKPSEKGVSQERSLAETLDLRYLNIPVSSRAPEWDQVDELAAVIGDAENYPILIHCVSSNRSGAIWSLYRARMGVPAEIAIQEGRTAGLESREKAVRKRLGIG